MQTRDYTGQIPVTPDQLENLRRTAKNGEYHLLMGAGASRDSKSRSGHNLPGGAGLITALQNEFGVIVEEQDQLWRIYDRAVTKAGSESVYSWLRARFWNVQHPTWMEDYARSPWAAVWTLNLDDTFESAFKAVTSERGRGIRSLSWDDEYRLGRNLNVIHLHGIVDRDEPRELIFSLTEYSSMAQQRATWPATFRDSYGNSPFVILGARLVDEPDIEAIISRRKPSHPAPTFYVSRSISPAMHQDLSAWGVIPVEMSAEEFTLEWSELIGVDLSQNMDADQEIGLRIGQQFVELNSNKTPPAVKNHDFLGGEEPTWADILGSVPTELEWVSSVKSDCNNVGRILPKSILIAYVGHRLTGRSTGLLQVALHLRQHSWRTFAFKHEGRIDHEALLAYAADGKAIALLFDGIADVTSDIDKLISEARASGLRVLCVCVEDVEREANILGRVSRSNIAHDRLGSINRKLTGVDAPRLVDRLSEAGRLGMLESENDRRRIAHFKGKELFDSMAQLEDAPGFGKRVQDFILPIDDKHRLNAILLSSYAARVGRRLLAVDLSRMLGINSEELIRLIQHDPQMQILLKTDGVDVGTRHRWMALAPVIQKLGDAAALDLIGAGIRALSPRIGRESLLARNPTAMLAGAFMSQKRLHELFPSANIDQWYATLIDIFGSWNARYWEQRAILARRESRNDISLLARAESFANRATTLTPDSYSFTTLGTVLLDRSSFDVIDIRKYYERGYDAFEKASRLERNSKDIVTWMAYLRCAINVLKRIANEDRDPGISMPTGDLWDEVHETWQTIYTQVRIVADSGDRTEQELTNLRHQFEKIDHSRKMK